MSTVKLPLEGGCRCDAVRIRITEAPLITFACHCHGCQRMSSSAFSLTAIFSLPVLTVTKGATVIGGLHGEELQHHFCGHCMTWMFTRPAPLPDMVNVRPTMFDDPSWFKAFAETYTKTKLPWAHTGAEHSFDEFPAPADFPGLLGAYAAASR